MEKSTFDWIALCLGIAGFCLSVANTVWSWRRERIRIRIKAEVYPIEGKAMAFASIEAINNGRNPVLIDTAGVRTSGKRGITLRNEKIGKCAQPGTSIPAVVSDIPTADNFKHRGRRLRLFVMTGDGRIIQGPYLDKLYRSSAR